MPENNNSKEQWHLSKSVPLSIIVVLLLQTIYFTVFITKLDSRVAVLEKDAIDTRKTIQDMAEIRIHQEYLTKKLDKLDDFLRQDVEWLPTKSKDKK